MEQRGRQPFGGESIYMPLQLAQTRLFALLRFKRFIMVAWQASDLVVEFEKLRVSAPEFVAELLGEHLDEVHLHEQRDTI